MSKRKVQIEFIAVATIEVDLEDLDSENYDLTHPEEVKQAIQEWVSDNAMPTQTSNCDGITVEDRWCQMEVVDTTYIKVLEE